MKRTINIFFNTKFGIYPFISIIVMFTVGIFAIFTRQPMSWYDEETHYARAIEISNGDLFTIKDNDWSQVGGRISKEESDFIDTAIKSKLYSKSYPAVDETWIDNYNSFTYTSKLKFRASTNTVTNNPLVYTPYILVAYLAKVVKLSPSNELLLMRIVGLITFLVIFTFAIKKIPFGKISMSMIGLLPPVFLSFSFVSADGYLFAITALYIAVLLEKYVKVIRSEANLKARDILEIALVSLALIISKMPTFLLIGLLVPLIIIGFKTKRISKKYNISFVMVIVVCAILTLAWYFLVKNVNSGLFWNRNVDTDEQIANILQNKKEILILFMKSIVNFNYFDLQIGYANSPTFMTLPIVVLFSTFMALIMSSVIDEDGSAQVKIQSKSRILFIFVKYFIILAYIILVFIMLYLQFSEVGSPIIEGVQPRYFIPLFFVFLLNPYGKSRKISNLQVINKIYFSSLLPVVIYLLFTMLQF